MYIIGSFEIDVVQYRGDSYIIGLEQGKEIDSELLDKFSIFENARFNLDGAIEVFRRFAPHLLDEIEGLADGLQIPFTQAASMFSGYDIPKIKGMGCSSVVNQDFAVRNYDFSPELYDQRFVLVQSKDCLASVGHSLHVLGRHEGVNEMGLFIALHFVNNDKPRVGLTAPTVVRIVLDMCENTNDAVKLLTELPHSWSYNFSVGDRSGETVIVEASPFSVKVRKNTETLTCTNHFQHDEMMKQNRMDHTYSFERNTSLEKKNVNELGMTEVFEWFRTPDSEMFYNDYQEFFGTLHTFGYSFNDNLVYTSIPYGETIVVDWGRWLNGYDITATLIKGQLIQKSL
ncbi:C45 family autoproteolytic acyltransferase/hydolase [Virgibacillus sp. DJP39]|uniref:C45 family autoproteolytic acyltransferase/hydolase n=1 Tax=Virgibacillus sp. DJP39 TaxID=3409790 RepID=UPI003BB78371